MSVSALPRGVPLRKVAHPPLVVGLPVVWCPTFVVSGLVQMLRRIGYISHKPPWGVLDDLVAPWGLRRLGQTTHWSVPCDCGRERVLRLWLAPDASRWGCKSCLRLTVPVVTTHAARLLFALRIGCRGRHATSLHLTLARALMGKITGRRGQRFYAIQAATVVLSYDPRQLIQVSHVAGPLMRHLQAELLDAWLRDWASPVAYHQRCLREICAPR